jgi:hypothetical protein
MALLAPMAYVFQQAQKAAAANHRRHGTAQADIGVVSGSREILHSERHTIVHSILPYDGPPGFNVTTREVASCDDGQAT